ncbi:sporulation protein YqfD [Oceanobacillus sp. J11TS1]|uniref:sporulation protein YqfD n=1 Tax=Oceanobacillus sp. J11TS1 TaxID=2807191 RepID=UPI001B0C4552|nr:sporulation protein YqfD [Oceanobacillus sp. J11TS1]GIO23098.1 sporulation protein YqfD [Oceanobacillus sp. J11TS1]
MKKRNSPSIRAYVTIRIQGVRPELFLQKCANQDILIWDVKKINDECCQATIMLKDIAALRKLRRSSLYKVSFVDQKGFPFFLSKLRRKRFLLVGILIGFLFFFVLSNLLWSVKITGVPKEIEAKIETELESFGVHPGVWLFSLASPTDIQRQLLNEVPELLWTGVNLQGTTLHLEAVEKTIVEELPPGEPRNLVATKTGVITNMYVSKGRAMVSVNDYVVPGKILVSGNLNSTEGDNNTDNEEKPQQPIAAEAEVIANTWYEIHVSVPLQYQAEEITGEQKKRHYLRFGDVQLPFWGFRNPDFVHSQEERKEQPIHFLKWELPFSYVSNEISETEKIEEERSKEEAIEVGIQQAKIQLQNELGPEAVILSEKILHEHIEHGKVELILYLSVEENIVKEEPIIQGD